jgi:NAD-dependent SIR2 family protein deacetylase
MTEDVVTPRIGKIEAVNKLYELIDQRNRLTIQLNQLKAEYEKQADPHVKKSVESLFTEIFWALKKTNRRIVLLDRAIAEGEVIDDTVKE